MGAAARRATNRRGEAPKRKRVQRAPLPYPGGRLRLESADQTIDAWALAFLSPVIQGDASAADLFVSPADRVEPWLRWKHGKTIDAAREAIAAHLAAGETGKPWPLATWGRIHAIGAALPGGSSWILNVDLDGKRPGYGAVEILAALAAIGAVPLVTSGSGRPGKYRALFKLDRWYSVHELQTLARALFSALGFPPVDGGLEVYPHETKCTRLPFGGGDLPAGGCTRYLSGDLTRGTRETPPALLRTLYELSPLPLADLVARITAAPVEPAPVAPPPVEPAPPPPVEPATVTARRKRRVKGSAPPDVQRWINRGVEPGERQRALVALAIHAWHRGMAGGEATAWIQDWIRNGGLDRSRFMTERRDGRERAIQDARRTVENVFRICSSWGSTDTRGKRVNAPPANPSADDLLALAPHVERVAAELAIPVARAGAFLLAVLPFFKGAAVAGHVDAWGRPIARIHWSIMHAASGDAYARIRDAFGLFEEHEGYLPASRAKRPEDARATTYALTLPLSADAPKRPLGGTWEGVIWQATRRGRSDVGKSKAESRA